MHFAKDNEVAEKHLSPGRKDRLIFQASIHEVCDASFPFHSFIEITTKKHKND